MWHRVLQALNSCLVDMKWCTPMTNRLRKSHCKSLQQLPTMEPEPTMLLQTPPGAVKWRYRPTTPCWNLPLRESWRHRITPCLRSARSGFPKPGKPQINCHLCGPCFRVWWSALTWRMHLWCCNDISLQGLLGRPVTRGHTVATCHAASFRYHASRRWYNCALCLKWSFLILLSCSSWR